MAQPVSRFPIPSLLELSVGSYLTSGQDRHPNRKQHAYFDEIFLQYMWTNLKTDVPKRVLCLQTTMSNIESAYIPKNNEKALESKVAHFFRKLAEASAPEFAEAGMALENRVPCSTSEYTQLQKTLKKKWSHEALLKLWTNSDGGGLRRAFQRLGAFNSERAPRSFQKIKEWLIQPENAVFLNLVESIHLNRLKIRFCPKIFNHFQFLKTLSLQKNKMQCFSCDLRPCKNLKQLFLSDNKIGIFTPLFPTNSKMKQIDLQRNQLDSFTVNLNSCFKLVRLDLSFNQIRNFSSNLKHCTDLKTVNLCFNNLQESPRHLIPDASQLLLARNPSLTPITPRGFIRTQPPEIVVLPASPRGPTPVAVAQAPLTDRLAPRQPSELERSPKSRRLQSPP